MPTVTAPSKTPARPRDPLAPLAEAIASVTVGATMSGAFAGSSVVTPLGGTCALVGGQLLYTANILAAAVKNAPTASGPTPCIRSWRPLPSRAAIPVCF